MTTNRPKKTQYIKWFSHGNSKRKKTKLEININI